MDVLHIAHQYAPETRGGVESYLADVTGEQLRRGADVQLLCGSHAPWPRLGVEPLAVDGLPVHRLHRDDCYFDLHTKQWHPGVAALLRDFLQRARPRVVHVHQWIRLTANILELCRDLALPTVVTLHDFYLSCPRAFRMRPGQSACLRPLAAASCRDCVPRHDHELADEIDAGIELFAANSRAELALADAVLVAVPSTRDLVATSLGVDRDRLELLPLGYRRRFPGLAELPAPVAGEPFRFAFWGGVARHKGIDVLVDALRRLVADDGPGVELHVLGGCATPAYERELRARGDGLPVRFHGPFTLQELRRVAPHAGVFPSTCLETFGFVLDECFELGLPAIVADHGALTARAGGGALRVAPGDPASLCSAMARLATDAALWQQLQRDRPALPPDIDEHCAQLAAVYDRVAAATAGRASLRTEEQPDPRVPLQRRVEFLYRQRESALRGTPPCDHGR